MVILQSYFPSYNYQQDKSTYYDSWITIQTVLKIAASNLYCKITLVWLDFSLSVWSVVRTGKSVISAHCIIAALLTSTFIRPLTKRILNYMYGENVWRYSRWCDHRDEQRSPEVIFKDVKLHAALDWLWTGIICQ